MQLIMVAVLFVTTIARVGGFLATPSIPEGGTSSIFVVISALGGVVIVRMLFGAVRLLPPSWRKYLDERGNPLVPPPMGRAARSPLSRMPQ